jgi:hypothetical protein
LQWTFPLCWNKSKGNGYRATTFAAGPRVAEAATRDGAVEKLRRLICDKLSGVELIQLQIPVATQPDPWLAVAGIWRDHPDAEAIEQNINEYRREMDADPHKL